MSIFRRDDDPPSRPGPPAPREPAAQPAAAQTSRIAAGTRVHGDVSGATPVVVEGEVEGRLQIEGLLEVGPRGLVRGDVEARVVRVRGSLVGNVRGGERVELLAGGKLEGDVEAPRVAIAEGSFFKGRVVMTAEPPRAAARPGLADGAPSPVGGHKGREVS